MKPTCVSNDHILNPTNAENFELFPVVDLEACSIICVYFMVDVRSVQKAEMNAGTTLSRLVCYTENT